MMKTIVLALALGLFACSQPAPVTVQAAATPPPPRTFSVVGTATLEVQPETARLAVTVSATAPRPGKAAEQARGKQAVLLAGLKHLGLEDADIALSHLSIDPVWDYRREKITGYSAAIRVVASTKDFGRLGTMMDAAAYAGATDMSSTFEADLTPLKKKVRDMALSAAKEKASQISDALDVKLAHITAIAESTGDGNWYGWGEASVPNAFAVEPKKIVGTTAAELQPLTLSISITYELG
jgi:uncharacterized protein